MQPLRREDHFLSSRPQAICYRFGIVGSRPNDQKHVRTVSIAYPSNLRLIRSHVVNVSEPSLASPTFDLSPTNWFASAIGELDTACSDAANDGIAVSDRARENAEILLKQLVRRVPSAPIVSIMPEGSVAIEFRAGSHAAVLLLCDANGSGACFEDMEGSPAGRARYADAVQMLDIVGWGALSRAKLLAR